jgi:hypothetical protein
MSKKDEKKEGKVESLDKGKNFSEFLQDPTKVEGGDPNYRYRYISTDKDAVKTRLMQNYEVVNKSTDPSVQTPHQKPDGTHTFGDVVLARIPKEVSDARRARARELHEKRLGAIRQNFEEGAKEEDKRIKTTHSVFISRR